MKTIRTSVSLASATAIVAASLLAASPAQAEEGSSPTVPAQGGLLEEAAPTPEIQALLDEGIFVTQEFVDNGGAAGGIDARAECSSWYGFTVPGNLQWHYSNAGCSLIGTTATARAYYKWAINPFSSGTACVDGRGNARDNLGFVYSTWGGLGCGSNGSGSTLWGKTAANKQVRGYATSSPMGFAGSFK